MTALVVLTGLPTAGRAAQQDEIQVYTYDMAKPGDYGLELHLDTTPSG